MTTNLSSSSNYTALNNRYYGDKFPNPWTDYSSDDFPLDLPRIFRFCEYVWYSCGTFSSASKRVIRYLLTELDFGDLDSVSRDKWQELMDGAGILSTLGEIGDNFLAYGNAFSSIYQPFKRFLQCPKCGREIPLSEADYTFEHWSFVMTCPRCKYHGEFRRHDVRHTDLKSVKVKIWSPHDISMIWHPVSQRAKYAWKPPAAFKEHVRRGDKFYLEDTPWELVDAVRNDGLFVFYPGKLHHAKEPTLAGVENRGWGIPRALAHFKQVWYCQMLRKANEAISLDWIFPLRIIAPPAGGGAGGIEPARQINLGDFKSNVNSIIDAHRRNPNRYYVLPFPLTYEEPGGQGLKFAPVDLLEQSTAQLLNDMGYPVDLYQGNLRLQTMPAALRLFDRNWSHLRDSFNEFLQWFAEAVANLFRWEVVNVRLRPVSLADDLENRHIMLNLMSAGLVSDETALGEFNIDAKQERQKKLRERMEYERQTLEMQKQQESSLAMMENVEGGALSQPGQAPAQPGMMPAQGAVIAPGADLESKWAQSEQMAQQLLSMPYTPRRQLLNRIRESDPTLHALVTQRMDTIRSQTNTAAGEAARQGQLALPA